MYVVELKNMCLSTALLLCARMAVGGVKGRASPRTGFMRDGALLKTTNFASLLVDHVNPTGERVGLSHS